MSFTVVNKERFTTVPLNSQQRAAVQYIKSPLLVVAGAGSGKTRVIAEKIVYLIKQGVEPEYIAAVTFTNKAAREMRDRVALTLNSESAQKLRISTFHALGLALIREEQQSLGLKPGFTIFDPVDSTARLSELLTSQGIKAADNAQLLQQEVSRLKGQLMTSEDLTSIDYNLPFKVDMAYIFATYNHTLRVCNAIDLDDLIYMPVRLLSSDPTVLERWQKRIRYLLVDEYQDTNAMQYMFVKRLIGNRGCVTAVGDDDQSIYSWRGAVPDNLVRLKSDFPDLSVIKLEQNYRSKGAILKAANLLIERNPHVFKKKLHSSLGFGAPPRVMVCKNGDDESERVALDINHDHFMHSRRWRDYAILYRGNHQARPFEKSLRALNIPYVVSGGISFFSLTEIRDLMAYLRLIANPADDNAFLRIANTPRRGLGSGSLGRFCEFAATRQISLSDASRHSELESSFSGRSLKKIVEFGRWLYQKTLMIGELTPVALAEEILEDINYRAWLETNVKDGKQGRRWENVMDLVAWIGQIQKKSPDSDLGQVIADLLLVDMLDDKEDADTECVKLMTLHAAKGLEFSRVYLVGMEDGLLPHRESLEGSLLEEERRLAYVGITRAKDDLCMTFARQRSRYGEIEHRQPSRFLEELKEADLRWHGTVGDPEESRARGRAALSKMRALLAE